MSWQSLFTPVNELVKEEPHLFEVLEIGKDNNANETNEKIFSRVETPMLFVFQLSQRLYNEKPLEQVEKIGQNYEASFKVKLTIGRRSGVGEAPSIANARQFAAYNLLLDIIEHDEFKKFLFPAETKAEALEFLKGLKLPVIVDKNWCNECIKLCFKKGFNFQPKYEFDDGVGPPHSKTFTCVAMFPGVKNVIETGPRKAVAKDRAALIMYGLLMALPDDPSAEEKRRHKEERKNQKIVIEDSDDDETLENVASSSDQHLQGSIFCSETMNDVEAQPDSRTDKVKLTDEHVTNANSTLSKASDVGCATEECIEQFQIESEVPGESIS